MNRNLFLVTSVILALSPGVVGVSARPARMPIGVLYNQNRNFGYGVNSQNFETSYSQYDDIAADDFVVPAGQTWHITEVDVTGAYVDGSGPASSVVVTFWKGNISPGDRIAGKGKDTWTLSCTDNAGSFACTLPNNSRGKPPQLRGGRNGIGYWLSVVANCSYSGGCGHWEWTTNSTVNGSDAAWKNPGGGWGTTCDGWGTFYACFGQPVADLAFDLVGY